MEKLGSILWMLILCSGLSAENINAKNEELLGGNVNCGTFVYEILISKMEYLEQLFYEQQLEMRKQYEFFQSGHESLEKIVKNKFSILESNINQQNSEFNQSLGRLQKKTETKFLNIESLLHQQNGEFKQTLGSLQKSVEGKFVDQESKTIQQNSELKQTIDSFQKFIERKFENQESKINQQNFALNRTLQSFQNQQNGELKQTLNSNQKIIESKFMDQESKISQQNGEFNQTLQKIYHQNNELNQILHNTKNQQNTDLKQTFNSLQKIVERKLTDQESKIIQHTGELNRSLQSIQNVQNDQLKKTVDSLQKTVERKFSNQESTISRQYGELKQSIVRLEKADDSISSTLNNITLTVDQKFNEVFDYFKTIKNRTIRSCKEEPTKVPGQYWLQPFANEKAFLGYCEQDKFGGGWLVIQHRFDGSVDFYRNWTDYKNGFGQMDGEFWLGLERIHRLTKGKKHSLVVEMETFDGEYGYAMYDGFEIGSEQERYSLKVLGAYSGTAGDSLDVHEGQKFSTHDNDNDTASENCAVLKKGAWWYSSCYNSNLNGVYQKDDHETTNRWHAISRKGLKFTRMMIREK